MNEAELRAYELARGQNSVITTAQAVICGMTASAVQRRLRSRRWQSIYRGAHLIALGPIGWVHKAQAAQLLAGENAALSHRTSSAIYLLDGCHRGPIELSVPYPREVDIPGVITHRSRALHAGDIRVVSGLRVTRIERTLAELGVYLPPVPLEKALESSFRLRLTTPRAVDRYLNDVGHRLPGARRLEAVLLARGEAANVAGSGAEVELIACLRERGIEPPVRQYRIDLGGGWRVSIDLAWPWRRFLAEYYGVDAHASSAALAYDSERENALGDAGFTLRKYGGGMVRRDPDGVAAKIAATIERCPLIAPVGTVDGL